MYNYVYSGYLHGQCITTDNYCWMYILHYIHLLVCTVCVCMQWLTLATFVLDCMCSHRDNCIIGVVPHFYACMHLCAATRVAAQCYPRQSHSWNVPVDLCVYTIIIKHY